ncbi:MAG: hypothetical protein WAO74_12940 [Polaribacter sp.]|uniref:hypothetical protein n=1 Tax=Polaribacter sp. TaxID=1920175 RepID=UPI003BB04894
MTEKETYYAKRGNFVEKTKRYFEFLITEFDFDKPIYKFSEQPNGVIISDEFEFNNEDKNLKIVLSNSYHPVDYGFEIILINLKTGNEEMLHYVLKENQDVEQNYLIKAAQYLKNGFIQRLS